MFELYPADKIRNMRSLPALIVGNTDASSKPGEQCLVLFIDRNRRGKYLNSFGKRPTERFTKYLNYNCVGWVWNERRIQRLISKCCGHYRIFYCLYRSRGFGGHKVARMFK